MSKLSVGDAGSMLMGAGLTKLSESVSVGLLLVGVGALLNIIVALLQKKDVPISASI